ncbi:cell wall-active antibiotics response protein LiaF [Paenibacillus lemnae]|uniref:Cell wall-active antibiotics response protein n=1 Tax=Paenibacillus lemnae TaxID=1330551 RepID=A0A848M958_PAELE|nr:cell wall-active antibiotics response protein LiaF [Paenibacillus lemnae]NMO96034.1 cell wall-active antibiotics response protein [Paenibacillus lemnae]
MSRKTWNQLSAGMLLIGIGAFFILNELGFLNISLGTLISTFWPVILIWAGLQGMMSNTRNGGAFFGSLIPLMIGVFFLGRNLNLFWFSLGDMIKLAVPAVLICCGLYVIFKPKQSRHNEPSESGYMDYEDHRDEHFQTPPPAPKPGKLESSLDEVFEQRFGTKTESTAWEDENRELEPPSHVNSSHSHWKGHMHDGENSRGNTMNKSVFIGDVHFGKDYFALKPTNVSQFIGDTVLDLTRAQIPYGETKINISAFIGDVKIFVPNDLDVGVHVSTSSFIGDMSVLGQERSGFMSSAGLESPDFREAGKKIRINVSVFIGDVKVNKVG